MIATRISATDWNSARRLICNPAGPRILGALLRPGTRDRVDRIDEVRRLGRGVGGDLSDAHASAASIETFVSEQEKGQKQ